MDLRSLIDKLDTIEQTQLLTESEELMERVGLRLQDIEQAVGRELDGNKRAAIIGDFARKFGYAGLFDPVSGKFVNKDGKFASFGAYQSEVEQLEDEGLIPASAKTDALLGFMGKDEKAAKPTAFARADLFGAIDKADGLLDKALDGILESKGIANSLLAEFGINTHLLEAITPEEHQFLKKAVKDAETIKHKADASNLITRYNKEYVPARNRLIKQIQTVIASIKPAAKSTATPAAAPAGERSGSSTSESLEMLREMSLTPQGQKAGAKLFQPSATGYLSPDQVKHNLALLKKGHAKLDWSDHVGKTVQDWANMATFDMTDRLAAAASSAFDPKTTYAKEREKQKAIANAYNQDPNALNVRGVAGAAGYKIDADNPVGNMTVGDVLGLVGPSAVTAMFNAGTKVATKIPKLSNTVGKLATGTAAVVGTDLATKQIDKVAGVGQNNQPVDTQPANLGIAQMQKELKAAGANLGTFGPKKDGVDGKIGKLTKEAMAKYPAIAKKYGFGGGVNVVQNTPDKIEPGQNARDDLLARNQVGNSQAGTDVNQSARQDAVRTDNTQVAAAGSTAQSQVAAADQIDPAQVQTAVAQLGIKDQISPDQLLALADKLGIKDGEQVADAGSNASNATANTITGPNMSGGRSNSSTTSAGGGDGGLVQGTTATAESLELNRILSLSGLNEDDNLEEGAFDKFLPWVFDQMIAKGMSREAQLAAKTPIRGMTRAEIAEIRAAKEIAKRVQSQGAPKAAGAVDDATKAVVNTGDDAAKAVANTGDDAAKAVANTGDDAAKAVAKTADDGVSKLTSQAAKGEGLLYNVGKLGGRFVRLVKNNKFVSLLAALAALGIALYVANKDNKKDDPVNPQPVVPVDGKCPEGYKLSKDGKTCEKDTGPVPGPAVDPKEEERKRQLADLEKLLAQLYGGWPTDPETAETIKAGIAAGAKAPAGFKEGGVQTQPAGGTSSSGSDRVFGGRGHAMSAQDLAAASSK